MIIQYKLGCNDEFNNLSKMYKELGLLKHVYYINNQNILFININKFEFKVVASMYEDKTFLVNKDKYLYIYSKYYSNYVKI